MLKKLIFVLTYSLIWCLICTLAMRSLWDNYVSHVVENSNFINWFCTGIFGSFLLLFSLTVFNLLNNFAQCFTRENADENNRAML